MINGPRTKGGVVCFRPSLKLEALMEQYKQDQKSRNPNADISKTAVLESLIGARLATLGYL